MSNTDQITHWVIKEPNGCYRVSIVADFMGANTEDAARREFAEFDTPVRPGEAVEPKTKAEWRAQCEPCFRRNCDH